ncbi:MAG: hypothetical protein ACRDLL_02385 [Solirubrobacterales bacterium]
MSEPAHGFEEGQAVWVEDGDGRMHPAIFLGETESASWLGGVPRAHVVDPETDQGEVVPIFRITPRDE